MKIMNFMMVLAILLGIVAASASAYALIETKPNYDAMKDQVADGPSTTDRLTFALMDDYRGTLHNLIYLSLGAGALAVVLGGVAVAKGRKPAALVGILLGIAGALVGVLSTPS